MQSSSRRVRRCFGVVVVPGDAIMVQEGEQLLPVLEQPLAIAFGYLRAVHLSRDGTVEPLHVPPVLAEMSLPQPILVDRGHNRAQQAAKGGREGLEFLIPGIALDIVVEIPDEMDETLLL